MFFLKAKKFLRSVEGNWNGELMSEILKINRWSYSGTKISKKENLSEACTTLAESLDWNPNTLLVLWVNTEYDFRAVMLINDVSFSDFIAAINRTIKLKAFL